MAKPAPGRAGVAPSLAPLPDMQCCAWCHRLAVGYQRAGGSFVCSECWADHIDKCPVEHTQEQEHQLAAPARCGVCGRRTELRRATRDHTQVCPDCWNDYEAACDAEEAYWQSQAHPDSEIAADNEGAAALRAAREQLSSSAQWWAQREIEASAT